jgi:Ni,Fe-hydrogenase III large subunit/Ni,Fe-hydrogenase III component G
MLVPNHLWLEIINFFHNQKARFVAIFAKENQDTFSITSCFEAHGIYYFLRTNLDKNNPSLPSITPVFYSANRMERHIRDLFGIEFTGNPDNRRWTRHQSWQENEYPLRKEFSNCTATKTEKIPPADTSYAFIKTEGTGVIEIPVGPIHAGIIEPGHFRFYVAGEDIINLEERLGYTHKGIEKIAEGRNEKSILRLSNRISGDSPVSYSWATAKAMEDMGKINISERGSFLRAILAERERIANHLWDVASICNDVGFSFAYFQLGRLREIMLSNNYAFYSSRLLMDTICFGGTNHDLNCHDISDMLDEVSLLKKELSEIYPVLEENSSLHDRLKTTGILTHDTAIKLGVLGYIAKACGIKYDVRVNAPYSPYNQFNIEIPFFNTGDVLARVKVRTKEILVSLDLLIMLLTKLPDGEACLDTSNIKLSGEAIGLIEGWRGEVFAYIAFSDEGVVERFFIRDPSWFNWLALEQLMHGNIIPDFPVCNKSINSTYSGVDL